MNLKAITIFFYFLHYLSSDAFHNPFAASFYIKKKDKFYNLLNSDESKNNELDNNDIINKKIRLGRSKDKDGKSNIWSVEPKIRVINEEITEVNKNILTVGLIISGFIASLPFLYTLNQYIQKIDF